MPYASPARISLGQFTTVFVPFGLLFAWALLTPELEGDLDLGRTKLTIWATTLLLLPALVLQLFRSVDRAVANLADLFWTAALLMFLVHAWWAIYIIFDGVADTFAQQGAVIAGGNFLLLVLWVVDVLWLWLAPHSGPRPVFHVVVQVIAFLIFAFTLVVLRGGAVQMLGFVFVGALVLAGIVRLGTHVRAPA